MRQFLYSILKSIRQFLADKLNQYNTTLPYLITVVIALVVVVGGINLFIELTDTLKTDILATFMDT